MPSANANTRKIDSAFEMACKSIESQSLRAVTAGTKTGYDNALALHGEHKHKLHLMLGGDFGYGVAKDRTTKEYEVVAGTTSANRTAERLIAQHLAAGPKKGILGVVSAGMDSANFHENYELGVLRSSFGKAREKAIDTFDNEG